MNIHSSFKPFEILYTCFSYTCFSIFLLYTYYSTCYLTLAPLLTYPLPSSDPEIRKFNTQKASLQTSRPSTISKFNSAFNNPTFVTRLSIFAAVQQIMQVRKFFLNSKFYKFISLKLLICLQEQSQETKNSKPTKTTVHASESKLERELLS